ncbi:hypothetical protein Tco_1555700 [Tanacetum coccineum]
MNEEAEKGDGGLASNNCDNDVCDRVRNEVEEEMIENNETVIEESCADNIGKKVLNENEGFVNVIDNKEEESHENKNETVNDVCDKRKNDDSDMCEMSKKLLDIPIEIDCNGNEVMVFDDIMVAEGSKGWEKTLCAYFVRYGISALASRVGKPLVMDVFTASMCKIGVGRVGFARVLVEISTQSLYLMKLRWFIRMVQNKKYQCGKNMAVMRNRGSAKNVGVENSREDVPKQRYSNGKHDSDGFIDIADKTPIKKAWSVREEILSAMKRSANKFSVLELYDKNELMELQGMKNRERKALLNDKGENITSMNEHNGKEVDDVFNDESGIAECMENDGLNGDMNVTLSSNEHSSGSSCMSSDMNDFNVCINSFKVEDIASSGLFFIWTKNLFKVKAGDSTEVLKKLDDIMRNEEFIHKFPQSHAIFIPYLIYDHCPNVIFVKHFQAFLGKVVDVSDFDSTIPLLKKNLTNDEAKHMVREIRDD